MFLANRVIPQHKEFLDDHGYEYKEIPEREFSRRMADCTNAPGRIDIETKESPGVLPLTYQELLYSVEIQPMTMCYKMLLLLEMTDHADPRGRVPISLIALNFKNFFQLRIAGGKAEENPNRFYRGRLGDRSIEKWVSVIREQPVAHLGTKFISDEGEHLRWAPEIWTQWSPDLRRELRDAAMHRLTLYFDKHVPGGF